MTTWDTTPSTTRPISVANPEAGGHDGITDAMRPSSTSPGIASATSAGSPAHRHGLSRWLGWGALSGFLAGAAFMSLHSWFAVSIGQDALAPYRTVATLVEGPPPLLATAGVGMVVHAVLSVLFGLLLAAALAPLRRRSAGWFAWAGLLFGGAVYVVDFQIFARNVGYFSALLETTNQPLELAAHLVFGAVLAALLLLAKLRAAHRRST
jgi:hypothetical protein